MTLVRTHKKWHNEVKRLWVLERENAALTRLIGELTLGNQMLRTSWKKSGKPNRQAIYGNRFGADAQPE